MKQNAFSVQMYRYGVCKTSLFIKMLATLGL